ncbi:MAG TPA: hypothetical protein VET66_15040 [Steroidobacteraceae bacterium]|nr:hypothetical protein [Steroidobacteraceae bacterium]
MIATVRVDSQQEVRRGAALAVVETRLSVSPWGMRWTSELLIDGCIRFPVDERFLSWAAVFRAADAFVQEQRR